MTSYFADKFTREHVCNTCRKSAAKKAAAGKKMCSTHLEVARLAFRIWSVSRRQAGGCCECSKTAVPGKGRCRRHWAKNRQDCREYVKANWESEHLRQVNYTRSLVRNRRCRCYGHPTLPEGFSSCADCRTMRSRSKPRDLLHARALEYRRKQIAAERVAAKAARIQARLEADVTRLARLGYNCTPGQGWASKRAAA